MRDPLDLERFAEVKTLDHLSNGLEPEEFEEFVASVMRAWGWDVSLTPSSGDHGVDVDAISPGILGLRAALQVKQKSNSDVGPSDIRKYDSIPSKFPEYEAVAVVSSRGFTSGAGREAELGGVITIPGERLLTAKRKLRD